MPEGPCPIVADGGERLAATPEIRRALGAALSAIRARYAPELEQAGFWRRLYLRWRMHREMQRAVDLHVPPGALYLAAGRTAPLNTSPPPASGPDRGRGGA